MNGTSSLTCNLYYLHIALIVTTGPVDDTSAKTPQPKQQLNRPIYAKYKMAKTGRDNEYIRNGTKCVYTMYFYFLVTYKFTNIFVIQKLGILF
jgi:hypothetical protein